MSPPWLSSNMEVCTIFMSLSSQVNFSVSIGLLSLTYTGSCSRDTHYSTEVTNKSVEKSQYVSRDVSENCLKELKEPSMSILYSLPVISITGNFSLPKLKKEKEETWLDKQLKEVTNGSIAKEMAVGGITGWCAGIVFSKVGKTAASALAGSLLVFQIAQHQGYIKVNWSKVNKDIEKAKGKLDKHSKKEIHWFIEESRSFIQEYKFLVTGFAGGFLIGIAMC